MFQVKLLVSTKVGIAVSTNKQRTFYLFSGDSYLILLLLQVTSLVKLRGQLKVTFQMVNSSNNRQI